MQETVLIRSEKSFILKNQITVTNLRFYGTTMCGKKVDLPIDSIKRVGNGFFRGVTVNTEQGKYRFKFIKNYKVFPEIISRILIERRERKTS